MRFNLKEHFYSLGVKQGKLLRTKSQNKELASYLLNNNRNTLLFTNCKINIIRSFGITSGSQMSKSYINNQIRIFLLEITIK